MNELNHNQLITIICNEPPQKNQLWVMKYCPTINLTRRWSE